MATEPFTGLPFTAAGQLQTDLEQNALLALMGPSLSGYATHNVTAGEGTAGEITLSYVENWMAFLTVTDDDTELAGPADLIMPANFPMRLVANATAQTITLKKAGQTGVALAAGSIGLFVSGAADVMAFSGGGGGATALSALTDVDLAGLADGDMILWDATAGKWVPIAPSAGATTLAALTDVDLTGLADGDVLAWDATNSLWVVVAIGGGGGLTNFAEAIDTAAPNATVPVVSLNATNAATNVDAAITPKGNGALVVRPSSAGINKRGQHAVDLNRLIYSSAHVASGDYSFAAGGSAATAAFSLAIGYGNVASNQYAVAFGYESGASGDTAFSAGYQCSASGIASVAIGRQAAANGDYSLAMGGDRAKTRGIAGAVAFGFWNYQRQRQFLGLYLTTYDATPAVAKSNSSGAGTANQLVLPNESVFVVEAMVSARHNSSGDCAAWKITAMVKRHTNAGSTAIVGTPIKTLLGADTGAAAWDVAVSADTSNGALAFTCTGDASRTTEWTIDTYSVQAVFS